MPGRVPNKPLKYLQVTIQSWLKICSHGKTLNYLHSKKMYITYLTL